MTAASVLSKSFAIVREDLHRRYDAACDAATIDSILDDVIAELSGSAKVTNFLPVPVSYTHLTLPTIYSV